MANSGYDGAWVCQLRTSAYREASCNIATLGSTTQTLGNEMTGRISLAAITICLGACASSGPEAPAEVAAASEVAAPTEEASPEAVDAVGPDESLMMTAADLDDPVMPGKATAGSAATADKPDEIVCRREKQTGSNFSRRVCRKRSDIEDRATDDQGALRQMRSTRSGSFQDMQGGGSN